MKLKNKVYLTGIIMFFITVMITAILIDIGREDIAVYSLGFMMIGMPLILGWSIYHFELQQKSHGGK